MSKKNVYLAAPFFSPEQIVREKAVAALLEANTSIDHIFQPMENQQSLIVKKYGGVEVATKTLQWQDATYRSDIRQINQADILVAIVDYDIESGNLSADEGTIFEIGYAVAQGKPFFIVEFDENDEPLNLMLTKYTAYWQGEKAIQQIADYDFINQPQIEAQKAVF